MEDLDRRKNEALVAAFARMSPRQLGQLAAAAADLHAAIEAEIASDPDRYASLATHDHPHQPHGHERPGQDRPSIDLPARQPVSEAGVASPIPGPAGV